MWAFSQLQGAIFNGLEATHIPESLEELLDGYPPPEPKKFCAPDGKIANKRWGELSAWEQRYLGSLTAHVKMLEANTSRKCYSVEITEAG